MSLPHQCNNLPVPKKTALQATRNTIARLNPRSQHRVHFVLIWPYNVTASPRTVPAIRRSAQHLQAWHQGKLGGKTFLFDVNAYRSSHASDWFANNPSGDDPQFYWWNNCLQDAYDLAGAGFWQFLHTWVVLVDAPMNPNQATGGTSGGYTSGVAVLDAPVIAALLERNCGTLGGLGHELDHTFGLPHPPPPDSTPEWQRGLMGYGYGIYPQSTLSSDDISTLSANPFFDLPRFPIRPPPGLCPFTQPPPTPHPLPPRPTRL